MQALKSLVATNSKDYSDYTDLQNHVDDPQFDVLIFCSAENDAICSIKQDLEKSHVIVAVKEYSKQQKAPFLSTEDANSKDKNSLSSKDANSKDAKFYLAIISEYNATILEELSVVLTRKKEQFVPIFCDKGLGQRKAYQTLWKRWEAISGRFGLATSTFNGTEEDSLKVARGVIGLLIEDQTRKITDCKLDLLLQQVKIHYCQCTFLVQKMMYAEEILKHVKIDCEMKIEVCRVSRHVLWLLECGKVLLHSCTNRFWLLTALFKLENEEEFGELISGLDEYCLLLIDLIFPKDVPDDLKELRLSLLLRNHKKFLSSCAKKDRKRLLNDIRQHTPRSGLVNFLMQKLSTRLQPEESIDERLFLRNKDIKEGVKLGEGSYGLVHEIKWNNIILARKTFSGGGSEEIGKLPSSRHPNVVTVIGYIKDASSGVSSMIMERMQSFPEFLKKEQLPFITCLNIILQIAKAMLWLHEQNIIHRDLKPGNILINSHDSLCKYLVVKITDFGAAKTKFRTSKTATELRGTVPYMAPEVKVFRKENEPSIKYSRKADVYSYGVTCHSILAAGDVEKDWGDWGPNVPICLAKYLKTCVDDDPQQRPSFEHICCFLQLIKKAHLVGIISSLSQTYEDITVFTIDKIIRAKAQVHHPSTEMTVKETIKDLRGWLAADRSITADLFAAIPNPQFLDGTQFVLKAVALQKYISINQEGDMVANIEDSSKAEKFKLWRCTESKFYIRASDFKFLSANKGEFKWVTFWMDVGEVFEISQDPEKQHEDKTIRVHITSNFPKQRRHFKVIRTNHKIELSSEEPSWKDSYLGVFEMTILDTSHTPGEYQLVNGYGYDKACEVLKKHRDSFVTKESFEEFAQQHINVVNIPVGWWIVHSRAPFVKGSLDYLDNAFTWAEQYNIKVIIELQAGPGYRDGHDGPDLVLGGFKTVHEASFRERIGFYGHSHGVGPRAETFDAMNLLHHKYAKHPALLRIYVRTQSIDNHGSYNPDIYVKWSFGQET